MDNVKFNTIKDIIKNSIINRFNSYNPEPAVMPFHTRLLGKDRLALYSFIHSLNTNFGTTIFEPVAVELAKNNFKIAKRQEKVGDCILIDSQKTIQTIMDDLTTANKNPDWIKESKLLRNAILQSDSLIKKVKVTKVDIYLENEDSIFLIDLKTAKPNKGGFKEFKRTLLEWTSIKILQDANKTVKSLIAIPYNPYDPKPYSRWTMAGMIDLKNELLVAEEFWDFLGGKGTYIDLLKCFEEVGIELREEIDNYFSKFS